MTATMTTELPKVVFKLTDLEDCIKPIVHEGAVGFLNSKRVRGAMPLKFTYTSYNDMLDLLYMD